MVKALLFSAVQILTKIILTINLVFRLDRISCVFLILSIREGLTLE